MTPIRVEHEEKKPSIDVFVARQPIFRRDLHVYGFELLYPIAGESDLPVTDDSAKLLANVFLSIGIDKLVGSRPAFVPCDRRMLTPDYASILPKRSLVLELPRTVAPTPEILESCRMLRSAGHNICVEDCRSEDYLKAWTHVADYLKVDFQQTPEDDCKNILKQCRGGRAKFIAGKLATHSEYQRAAELGFDYFQGFFAQPTVVTGRALAEARITQLQVLREVARDEIDTGRVEKLIQQDVSLTYKLLRYINSAAFAWRTKIKSVKHAIGLIGEGELRKWACMIMVMSLGGPKASPFLVKSLVRAQFGELIASRMGMERSKNSMFLLGLLSHLDSIMACPMQQIVEDLSLHEELRDVLLNKSRSQGLGRLFTLIEAYDSADWVRAMALVADLRLTHTTVTECYVRAVEWAELVTAV